MTEVVVAASAARLELAHQLLERMPAFKRALQAGIPVELREELAHVTTHQLEALGLLMQLRDREGGATMQQVAQMQGCALSTATALADRLIRQGLAERLPDDEDRRVVKIVPTPRARALLQKFIDSRRQIALAALEPLSDHEAATFVRLLRKMTELHSDACGPWRSAQPPAADVANG